MYQLCLNIARFFSRVIGRKKPCDPGILPGECDPECGILALVLDWVNPLWIEQTLLAVYPIVHDFNHDPWFKLSK